MRLDSFDGDAAVRGRVGQKRENGTLIATVHGEPIRQPSAEGPPSHRSAATSVPDGRRCQAMRSGSGRRSGAEKSPVPRRSPHRLAARARAVPGDHYAISAAARGLPGPVRRLVLERPLRPHDSVAFRRILCPIDYSPSALKALEYALEFSRQANGRVTVMHVLEYATAREPADPEIGAIRSQVECAARRRLHELLANESPAWCDIDEVVARSSRRASSEILRRTAGEAFDLVVMGGQGPTGRRAANTHDVVSTASCPVLTVRA